MNIPPSVLVVDDSPTARQMTREMLERAGYEVITADDGDHALELFETHRPDAVILDVILPKKNGFQVCRQLKSQRIVPARVLMLTSKSQESDRVWGRRQGADDYLTKPFESTELLDSLEKLLLT